MHPPIQEGYKHSIPQQRAVDLFKPPFDLDHQWIPPEDRVAYKARIAITFRFFFLVLVVLPRGTNVVRLPENLDSIDRISPPRPRPTAFVKGPRCATVDRPASSKPTKEGTSTSTDRPRSRRPNRQKRRTTTTRRRLTCFFGCATRRTERAQAMGAVGSFSSWIYGGRAGIAVCRLLDVRCDGQLKNEGTFL